MTRKSLTAGCNCGKSKNYAIADKDGRVVKRVQSLSDAMRHARSIGGTYKRV